MKTTRITSTSLTALGAASLAIALSLAGCTGTSSPAPTSLSSSAPGAEASIAELLKAGIAQGDAGKFSDAIATFNNVLLLDKGNKFAYFNLGVIADAQGDTQAALTAYNAALKTDPKFTPALFNKAIILESSDKDQAISIYQNIVQLDPKAATAFLRLSFLLDAQGKTDDAKTARDEAVSLDKSLAGVPSPFAAGGSTATPSPAPTTTPNP